MRNEIVTLVARSVEGSKETTKETLVFAERKSVRQSEFYAAVAIGLSPTLVFNVDARDFENASTEQYEPAELIYNDKHYNIIRTYEVGDDIEITVGR